MGGSTTLPSRSARYVTPAIAAPTIGAIQNSHSCSSAQPPDEDRRPGRKPATSPKTHRHGRIEVAAGNRSERVGTGEHGEPERERHTEQPDARCRERGGQHRTAAASQHEPERTEKFCPELCRHEPPPIQDGSGRRRRLLGAFTHA
jgi:hypothetical protein